MATSHSAVTPARPLAHLWGRQAGPTLAAIVAPDRPARGVIVGSTGSGTSSVLQEIIRLLSEQDRPWCLVDESTDIPAVPAAHVLIVDDLNDLAPHRLDQLAVRVDDVSASIVVACRPSPRTDVLTHVTRAIERSQPAIVLGQVSVSDVMTFLEASGRHLAPDCIELILECTGGVSWLVSEALALHDERDCAVDRDHRSLRRAVEERVIHRLDTISPALREEVVTRCLLSSLVGDTSPRDRDLVASGYAEGLLLRSGRPVPVVRSAVRAAMPTTALPGQDSPAVHTIALSAAGDDSAYREWVSGAADDEIGRSLIEHGDRVLDRDPARALQLYTAALECGVDARDLAARRAQAAWAVGDLEAASRILDAMPSVPDTGDTDRLADTSAAIWSGRGMMRMSDAVYRSLPPAGAESRARATVAALGIGEASTPATPAPARGIPSTLGVAMELLERGLRASLAAGGAEPAVADLVRASEMYTASAATAPIPELPAVIAAAVAVSVGELDIAQSTIEDAIRGSQGGPGAGGRLLLWRSWLAVQRSRPADARQALADAVASGTISSARDAMLAHAIRVAIARRYEDSAALEAIWVEARDSVLRTEADLYTLLPLTELMAAAARVDDTARVLPHFSRALAILDGLGSPPIWAAHVHWSGIQQGILLNRPGDLEPHARALVTASAHSAVAGVMAQAGKVWTATLAGAVDPDAVEAAAHGLASAGLAWDGARLAGHGAGRSTDRRISARLLSCARELHPNDGARPARPASESGKPEASAGDTVLSERETDVARLVLQGKTYAEIGQTIFISPRTAEHHIAHIRRRLGATSRSDLLSKLRVIVEEDASAPEIAGARPGSP